MTEETSEITIDEPHGLDDLIQQEDAAEIQEQRDQEEAQAKAAQPSEMELERAKRLAEQMNGAFLFGVDKMICPSVDFLQVVDPEVGNEKLLPLALAMGGEVPAWIRALLDQYQPYIAAGLYMGTTIFTARKLEMVAREQAERREKQRKQEGQNHGPQ
ncbi:hypothetical protein HBA55_34390 [Pseudomaricurvus alkylphenolicus]|uniref:hypothetical protein n=1 Tax=Pseudomaricurvus alkylphenolicus TaxID=1306991 RepID=UPI001421602A|nr:hypothetical protein [Pseudomaricurvus alkylphenolicus]NIB44720.1 hypothetical protein [Pseudomaricurvus alkylphenolicus]